MEKNVEEVYDRCATIQDEIRASNLSGETKDTLISIVFEYFNERAGYIMQSQKNADIVSGGRHTGM